MYRSYRHRFDPVHLQKVRESRKYLRVKNTAPYHVNVVIAALSLARRHPVDHRIKPRKLRAIKRVQRYATVSVHGKAA